MIRKGRTTKKFKSKHKKGSKLIEKMFKKEYKNDQPTNQEMIPFLSQVRFKSMRKHKLILIFAIIDKISRSNKQEYDLNEVFLFYFLFCKNSGLKPKSSSKIRNYMLKIEKEISSIEIPNNKLLKFKNYILKILKKKGVNLPLVFK